VALARHIWFGKPGVAWVAEIQDVISSGKDPGLSHLKLVAWCGVNMPRDLIMPCNLSHLLLEDLQNEENLYSDLPQIPGTFDRSRKSKQSKPRPRFKLVLPAPRQAARLDTSVLGICKRYFRS
jgi:hypothetical protein